MKSAADPWKEMCSLPRNHHPMKKKKRKKKKRFGLWFKESKFPRSLKGMTTTMTHEEPVFLHMLKCNSHEYCHWKIIIENTQRAKMLWAKVFCLTILWCCHVGNHPQEELAKLARKVENFKESYYILATCWNLLSKKHADFRTFVPKSPSSKPNWLFPFFSCDNGVVVNWTVTREKFLTLWTLPRDNIPSHEITSSLL